MATEREGFGLLSPQIRPIAGNILELALVLEMTGQLAEVGGIAYLIKCAESFDAFRQPGESVTDAGERAAKKVQQAAQARKAASAKPVNVAAEPPGSTMLLTVEQTAAELHIARRRIFEMIADGTLPSVKIGKSRRITRTALEEYVRKLES